jgi:hypothetical protein
MVGGYIQWTGLSFHEVRIDEESLHGKEITQDMLYHMFASGLFDYVRVKFKWSDDVTAYGRDRMMKFVQELDRLEIRRLRAELAELKERKKD